MSEPFIGEVRAFPYNFAPRGWAMCDGQVLPISENTALFSIISTFYGGDGRTTFALPDLQERIPIHAGQGPGLTQRRLGNRSSSQTVALDESQIPNHTHTLSATREDPTSEVPTDRWVSKHMDDDLAMVYKSEPTLDATMASSALSTTGGSQAHNNMQPVLTLTFCIALVGIYPSRS